MKNKTQDMGEKKKLKMKKEILRITMDLEDLPANAQIMDLRVTIIEDGWYSRIFKNWKRIKYEKVYIKSLEVIR